MVTSTLLVSFGRISDMFGRVRLFNMGFAIFTIGSLLCALTPNTGDLGAQELITFRIVQGVGGAFLLANSAAILTDAFPPNERGKALGINMTAAIAGSLVGLVLGGILAIFDWRYIFLVSVPVGVFGDRLVLLEAQGTRHHKEKPEDRHMGQSHLCLGADSRAGRSDICPNSVQEFVNGLGRSVGHSRVSCGVCFARRFSIH